MVDAVRVGKHIQFMDSEGENIHTVPLDTLKCSHQVAGPLFSGKFWVSGHFVSRETYDKVLAILAKRNG